MPCAIKRVPQTFLWYRFVAWHDSGKVGLNEGLLPLLKREGFFDQGYQVVCSETATNFPEFPVGFMRWKPVSEGPKFEDFRQLWSLMRADDVLSESARAALGIDQFRVPLEEATVPPVTDAGFLDPELGLSLYEPFLFDALYTFVIAINVLLNGGTPVEDIKGELLLNQLRRTEFEGISGSVAFDENGDRQASYELVNLHPDGSFRVAGLFTSSLGQFSVANGNVYWVGGVKADYPPFFLTDCGPGSYKDVDLGQCIPCAKGFQCVNGTQELCPKGTFSNETGLVACQLCVKGSFSSDLGSTKCRSCPAGFFADQEGMESCKRCPKGSYMPDRHADSCLDCGMDQVTEESGSQLFRLPAMSGRPQMCGWLGAPSASSRILDEFCRYVLFQCAEMSKLQGMSWKCRPWPVCIRTRRKSL